MDRLEVALRKAQELAKTPLSYVYLVQCEEFVKIGYAAYVKHKVSTMQTGNPFKVNLLATIPTRQAMRDENLLHNAFDAYHHRGEWFTLPTRVLNWIKDNKKSLTIEGLIQQALA